MLLILPRLCSHDSAVTLAGSALTMDRAVRNAREFLRCGLEEAVRMATRTPAESLGLDNKGRIAPGADADLTVLDEQGAKFLKEEDWWFEAEGGVLMKWCAGGTLKCYDS